MERHEDEYCSVDNDRTFINYTFNSEYTLTYHKTLSYHNTCAEVVSFRFLTIQMTIQCK